MLNKALYIRLQTQPTKLALGYIVELVYYVVTMPAYNVNVKRSSVYQTPNKTNKIDLGT